MPENLQFLINSLKERQSIIPYPGQSNRLSVHNLVKDELQARGLNAVLLNEQEKIAIWNIIEDYLKKVLLDQTHPEHIEPESPYYFIDLFSLAAEEGLSNIAVLALKALTEKSAGLDRPIQYTNASILISSLGENYHDLRLIYSRESLRLAEELKLEGSKYTYIKSMYGLNLYISGPENLDEVRKVLEEAVTEYKSNEAEVKDPVYSNVNYVLGIVYTTRGFWDSEKAKQYFRTALEGLSQYKSDPSFIGLIHLKLSFVMLMGMDDNWTEIFHHIEKAGEVFSSEQESEEFLQYLYIKCVYYHYLFQANQSASIELETAINSCFKYISESNNEFKTHQVKFFVAEFLHANKQEQLAVDYAFQAKTFFLSVEANSSAMHTIEFLEVLLPDNIYEQAKNFFHKFQALSSKEIALTTPALDYAQKSIALFNSLGKHLEEASVHRYVSQWLEASVDKDLIELSAQYLIQAIDTYKQSSEFSSVTCARLYHELSEIFERLDKIDEAIKYSEAAISYFKASLEENKLELGHTYYRLGYLYKNLSLPNWSRAASCLESAISIFENQNQTRELAISKHHLSMVYLNKKSPDFEKSIQYSRSAFKILYEISATNQTATVENKLELVEVVAGLVYIIRDITTSDLLSYAEPLQMLCNLMDSEVIPEKVLDKIIVVFESICQELMGEKLQINLEYLLLLTGEKIFKKLDVRTLDLSDQNDQKWHLIFRLTTLHQELYFGDRQRSVDLLNILLRLFRDNGKADKRLFAIVGMLSSMDVLISNFHEVAEILEKSVLDEMQQLTEPKAQNLDTWLMLLAQGYKLNGQTELAVDSLGRLVNIWREIGNEEKLGVALSRYGLYAQEFLGKHLLARSILPEAIDVLKKTINHHQLTLATVALARNYHMAQPIVWTEASSLYRKALFLMVEYKIDLVKRVMQNEFYITLDRYIGCRAALASHNGDLNVIEAHQKAVAVLEPTLLNFIVMTDFVMDFELADRILELTNSQIEENVSLKTYVNLRHGNFKAIFNIPGSAIKNNKHLKIMSAAADYLVNRTNKAEQKLLKINWQPKDIAWTSLLTYGVFGKYYPDKLGRFLELLPKFELPSSYFIEFPIPLGYVEDFMYIKKLFKKRKRQIYFNPAVTVLINQYESFKFQD